MKEDPNQILPIIRAISIDATDSFTFAGAKFGGLDPALSMWQPTPTSHPLVAQLTQQIYRHAYCRKFDGRLVDDDHESALGSINDLLGPLTAANKSRERWDGGWQVNRLMPSTQLIAYKGAATRLVWPGEFVSHEGPGLPVKEGARISLYAARDSTIMQPGFYFIFGETLSDQQNDYNLVRFYWHILADGVPALIDLITTDLNRFQIPFRLKALTSGAFYRRSDAAVLYVNKRFYRLVSELIADIHHQITKSLVDDTPLFSKPLAAGLGFAEEPGNGESFGQNRCRMMAEGIWNAYENGLHGETDRLEAVRQHFSANGFSLEEAYLNPGSTDDYEFPRAALTSLK